MLLNGADHNYPGLRFASNDRIDLKITQKYTIRIITMRTKLSIALTLLVLIGAAPLLGACHTTAGAGEDISATGHVITHDAHKATP
jgi:predicted small secreted protein